MRPSFPPNYSTEEFEARNRAFKASRGVTSVHGELWDDAWDAARAFYAPNADEAQRLRRRLGLAAAFNHEGQR